MKFLVICAVQSHKNSPVDCTYNRLFVFKFNITSAKISQFCTPPSVLSEFVSFCYTPSFSVAYTRFLPTPFASKFIRSERKYWTKHGIRSKWKNQSCNKSQWTSGKQKSTPSPKKNSKNLGTMQHDNSQFRQRQQEADLSTHAVGVRHQILSPPLSLLT